MKKKYLKAAACVAAMALAMLSHAHPAHAEGTQGVPVTVNYADTQKARAPSVMIPREIYLKDETQCSYEVWAYCPKDGLGALLDSVAVTPSESFTLTNERTGATFTGSATQGKTEFLPDDVKGGEACEVGGVQAMKAAAQGSISVDGIQQGRWTGAVVFTVNEIPHNHAWTVPVLSDDKLIVVGYACPCGETSHAHTWDIVHKVESGFSAGAVKYWECSGCHGTIDPGSYDELRTANDVASETIKQAWITKNITEGMTDSEKVKAVLNEMHSWEYGPLVSYAAPNITRRALCASGNSAFVDYCKTIGIRAELHDASKELQTKEHWIAYVWIDGEQCMTDATPDGHGLMGHTPMIWTMDGYSLYLDYLDGYVTIDEFNQWITAEER